MEKLGFISNLLLSTLYLQEAVTTVFILFDVLPVYQVITELVCISQE